MLGRGGFINAGLIFVLGFRERGHHFCTMAKPFAYFVAHCPFTIHVRTSLFPPPVRFGPVCPDKLRSPTTFPRILSHRGGATVRASSCTRHGDIRSKQVEEPIPWDTCFSKSIHAGDAVCCGARGEGGPAGCTGQRPAPAPAGGVALPGALAALPTPWGGAWAGPNPCAHPCFKKGVVVRGWRQSSLTNSRTAKRHGWGPRQMNAGGATRVPHMRYSPSPSAGSCSVPCVSE